MQRCPFCTITWVDHAYAETGVRMTDLARRRLIAALLSRQHLILSGQSGIGKRRLAHALALSIAGGRQHYVRLVQGHPWWAARTGNIARYVGLQTEFTMWRMVVPIRLPIVFFTQSLNLLRGSFTQGYYIVGVA